MRTSQRPRGSDAAAPGRCTRGLQWPGSRPPSIACSGRGLRGVHAVLLGARHVEAHLHEGGLCTAVLVELQGHLVLARGTLGHVAERDLEDRLVASVEGKQLPTKLHGSPVPTLHTQILLH